MDFIDVLRQFSSRAEKLRQQIQTEEATKTSLIMPFFQQVMGYDVFNPDEFVPEFTADVGIKKARKSTMPFSRKSRNICFSLS